MEKWNDGVMELWKNGFGNNGIAEWWKFGMVEKWEIPRVFSPFTFSHI